MAAIPRLWSSPGVIDCRQGVGDQDQVNGCILDGLQAAHITLCIQTKGYTRESEPSERPCRPALPEQTLHEWRQHHVARAPHAQAAALYRRQVDTCTLRSALVGQ